jgi:hypothetical protein
MPMANAGPHGLQHHFFVVAFEADHAAIGDGLHLHRRFDDEPTIRTAIERASCILPGSSSRSLAVLLQIGSGGRRTRR